MPSKLAPASPLRVDPETALASLDWREVFGREGRIEVEIGIGKGRFLLAAAEGRPEVLHFGVEWANEFLRIAEARAEKRGLENVRFARVDAGDFRAQNRVPRKTVPARKRHHHRDVAVRNRREPELLFQARKSRRHVRPAVDPMPGKVELGQRLLVRLDIEARQNAIEVVTVKNVEARERNPS